jgi:hypothetical protein
MKKNVKEYEIEIKSIDTNLSENTKRFLEYLEWANRALEAYATQLFMIR